LAILAGPTTVYMVAIADEEAVMQRKTLLLTQNGDLMLVKQMMRVIREAYG